jgi:hypothetical protein
MGKRFRGEVFVSALVLMLAAGSARAAGITFAFSATIFTVVDILNALPDTIQAGDVVTGRYTFDPDAPATVSLPGAFLYQGAVCRAQARVEGLEFNGELAEGDDATNIQIADEAPQDGGTEDRYIVQLFSDLDLAMFFINLDTPGPSDAIVGTDIPTVPPDPSRFENVDLQLLLGNDYTGVTILGDVTELALASQPLPCPEPDGVGAVATCAALLALGARRRWGRRAAPA